jgi:hypothetical protein
MHSNEQVAAKLAAWRGGIVQVWNYHVSHSVLRLSLKGPTGRPAILDLVDCARVMFDQCWRDCNFSVTFSGTGNRRRCLVSDGSRFGVDCGGLFLTEDREPPI